VVRKSCSILGRMFTNSDRWLGRLSSKTGLRFHDLRHACATISLSKEASEVRPLDSLSIHRQLLRCWPATAKEVLIPESYFSRHSGQLSL
jgi:integrase